MIAIFLAWLAGSAAGWIIAELVKRSRWYRRLWEDKP